MSTVTPILSPSLYTPVKTKINKHYIQTVTMKHLLKTQKKPKSYQKKTTQNYQLKTTNYFTFMQHSSYTWSGPPEVNLN